MLVIVDATVQTNTVALNWNDSIPLKYPLEAM